MSKLKVAQDLIDIFYPIGSVYLTRDFNFDPNEKFGGTWVRQTGAYIYCCIDELINGWRGSEPKTVSHKLTIDEIPPHNHAINQSHPWNSTSSNSFKIHRVQNTYDVGLNFWTENSGGGKGHTHDIPYIGVFFWARTA